MYAIASYAIWGVLPIYWKFLKPVEATEVLAHRILWSFAFVAVFLGLGKLWPQVWDLLRDRRRFWLTVFAAVMISINWGLYIWSIQTNHILDSSLGYYINPLVAVLLGVILFKERLSRGQLLAITAAAIGVLILVLEYGRFPWLSFSLAVTFGLYGALKKLVQVPSLVGLAVETAVLLPFSLAWIGVRQLRGTGALGHSTLLVTLLLLGAGAITAIPLLLFAEGARRIPLSTLGITQYISPTLMFILGIFVYQEPFRLAQGISFGLIWLALIIYTLSQRKVHPDT